MGILVYLHSPDLANEWEHARFAHRRCSYNNAKDRKTKRNIFFTAL